jgi:HEAT repeat protein
LCGDPHPKVRGHAARALGRIGSPAAVAALLGQSNVEVSQEVRAEISMALQHFEPSPSGMLD